MSVQRLTFGLLLLASFSLGGCIKRVDYEAALADIERLQAEVAAEQRRLSDCRGELDAREQELSHCRGDYDEAVASVERLASELTAMGSTAEQLETQLVSARERAAELEEQRRQAEARASTFRGLVDQFRSLIDAGTLDVRVERNRMVVKLASNVLFSSGSTRLTREGSEVLTEVAQILSTIPDRNYQVEGHTDDVPTGSSSQFASNWDLSAARAVTVVRLMVDEGLSAQRVSAAGYGEFVPVADNETPEGRALNRRIEIVLLPNLDELPDLSSLEEG